MKPVKPLGPGLVHKHLRRVPHIRNLSLAGRGGSPVMVSTIVETNSLVGHQKKYQFYHYLMCYTKWMPIMIVHETYTV